MRVLAVTISVLLVLVSAQTVPLPYTFTDGSVTWEDLQTTLYWSRAAIDGYNNVYSYAFYCTLNSNSFTTNQMNEIAANHLRSDPQSFSNGVDAFYDFQIQPTNTSIMRAFLSLTNTDVTDQIVDVTCLTQFYDTPVFPTVTLTRSDNNVYKLSNSDGDLTIFMATSGNGFVLDQNESSGSLTTFTVSLQLAPGEQQSVLHFQQLLVPGTLANVEDFETLDSLSAAGYLTELTQSEIDSIVNFGFLEQLTLPVSSYEQDDTVWSSLGEQTVDSVTGLGWTSVQIAGAPVSLNGVGVCSVNGTPLTAQSLTQIAPGYYRSEAQSIGGLSVVYDSQVQQADSEVLRTVILITNNDMTSSTATIECRTDIGSSISDPQVTTSSGDATFSVDDSEVIVRDGSGTASSIVLTFTNGAGELASASQDGSVFLFSYDVELGAEALQSVVFFTTVRDASDPEPQLVQGANPATSQGALRAAGYMSGLDSEEIESLVNVLPALAIVVPPVYYQSANANWSYLGDLGTRNPYSSQGRDFDNGDLLGWSDASYENRGDAFDGAFMCYVGSEPLGEGVDELLVLGSSQYRTRDLPFLQGSLIAFYDLQINPQAPQSGRGFLSVTNNATSTISTNITCVHNFGSDGSTTVQASSSGDNTFNVDDSYVVTDDQRSGDPTLLSVFSASGFTLSAAYPDFYGGNDNYGFTFDFDLAPQQTKSVLFFERMAASVTEALNAAPIYSTLNSLLAAGYLDGLSAQELSTIVNFIPASPSITPTLTPTMTSSPSITPTSSPSGTSSSTGTVTPTPSPTGTSSSSTTGSLSATRSPSSSNLPVSGSVTVSFSNSPVPSSATNTPFPSNTGTPTRQSGSFSSSSTVSVTFTASSTVSVESTPSASLAFDSASATPFPSASRSRSPSSSSTSSLTSSSSLSESFVLPSFSATRSQTTRSASATLFIQETLIFSATPTVPERPSLITNSDDTYSYEEVASTGSNSSGVTLVASGVLAMAALLLTVA